MADNDQYRIENGEVLVKVSEYELHRGEKREILRIHILKMLQGTNPGVPEFAAILANEPAFYGKAKPGFAAEASTEDEALRKILINVRGKSLNELFEQA